MAASFACFAALVGAGVEEANGQGVPMHQPGMEGKRVYEKANCVGCHKWHGDGGGGYGGAALSLRKTALDREQIMEVTRCGRPETGMPFHQRGAYDDPAKPCYGASRQDLDKSMPPEAVSYLRASDVEAVADYVIANIKGKGEVTHADCTAFFGTGSRLCNSYETTAAPHGGASGAPPRGH